MPERSVTSSKVPSPSVAEEAIALRAGGCRRRFGERTALDAIDVEPAVAVVVEQAHAAAHRLGQPAEGRGVIVVDEAEAGGSASSRKTGIRGPVAWRDGFAEVASAVE